MSRPLVILLLCCSVVSSHWTDSLIPKLPQDRQSNETNSPVETAQIAATVGAAWLFWDALSKGVRDLTAPVLEDYEDCGELGVNQKDQCWWDCQDWEDNPNFKDTVNQPTNFQWPKLPKANACYQDCMENGNAGELPAGASASVAPNPEPDYPWLCSLQYAGYHSNHICGVTLLSGPTSKETILVGAAQCNLVCKDRGNMLNSCCCLDPEHPASCRKVSIYIYYGA